MWEKLRGQDSHSASAHRSIGAGSREPKPEAWAWAGISSHERSCFPSTTPKRIKMSVQYVQAAQGKRGDKLAPRSIWQREPLNTLWAGSIFLRILAIQLPYFSLKYLLPSLRPIKTWSWGRAMLIALIRQKGRFRPTGKLVIRINFEGDQKATFKPHPEGTPVWIPKLEKPLTGELGEMMAKSGDTLARNSAWWYGKDHSKKPDGKGKVILYFHGFAAFLEQSLRIYADLPLPHRGTYFEYGSHPASPPTAPLRLSLAATSKIGNEPVRGLALEYRLSHIASLPGIISDAVAAWRYLVEDCGYSPEDIVVGGDSAGGEFAGYLASDTLTD